MPFSWPELLEGVMLVCFGVSWPFNIRKTLKQRASTGKSFMFIGLVLLGYIAGIASKWLLGPLGLVTILWMVNALMVATDLSLTTYYHYHPGGRFAGENTRRIVVAALKEKNAEDDTGIVP